MKFSRFGLPYANQSESGHAKSVGATTFDQIYDSNDLDSWEMIARLAIRSASLSALALFAVWYALLGGRTALEEAVPEISAYAPAPIVADRTEAGDGLGWLLGFAILLATVAVIAAVRRSRGTPHHDYARIPSLAEQRLWAEHLAWLAERNGAAVQGRLARRRPGGVNLLSRTERLS